MNETIVPPRQRRFAYKAKGKARAKSPSPPLPSPPSPALASHSGVSASSSHTSHNLSASAARKRSRTYESASDDDDDDDTPEPPTKRQKQIGNKPRPLVREGAFYHYPTPATPAQEEEDAEPQTMPVNLVKCFLDQVQDLDVSHWPPRSCDPYTAERDNDKVAEDDDWAESSFWTQREAWRQRPRRGVRVVGGVGSDDAMRRPALGSTNSEA